MKICCVELGNILHGFTPTGTLQSRALLLLNIVRLGNILDGFTKGVQLKNGLIFVISTTTMEKETHRPLPLGRPYFKPRNSPRR